MTDQTSPAQRALDLLVYAPTGLLLTVVEELPQLASKGRRRIEGQVTTARVVGQFSVQFARQQLKARWPRPAAAPDTAPATRATSDPAPATRATSDPAPATRATSDPGSVPEAASFETASTLQRPPAASKEPTGALRVDHHNGGTQRTRLPTGSDAAAGSSARGRRAPTTHQQPSAGGTEVSPSGAKPPSGSDLSGDVAKLGIPGYDSLSASQVVQRLPGLSTADLRRVRDHEAANRHRRTILNRAEQLLDGASAPARTRAQDGAGAPSGPSKASAPDANGRDSA